MDLTNPSRGSSAVGAGLLTPKMLRGPRFRRLFPDIYVSALAEIDLALRSRAAYLLVEGHGGVVGGHSAAELLGASCGPENAPAEVVPPGRMRAHSGLRVREEQLAADDITWIDDVAMTTPLRTAYDLARRRSIVEAVVAVDALTHAFPFAPQDLIAFSYHHLGARGSARLPEVVRLANPLAESPMETRIRLAILFDGLPMPVLQHPVGPYLLDLAYPEIRLGIEYDGREHLKPERALRDLDRQAYLTANGWGSILRFRAGEVLHRPTRVAGKVLTTVIVASRT